MAKGGKARRKWQAHWAKHALRAERFDRARRLHGAEHDEPRLSVLMGERALLDLDSESPELAPPCLPPGVRRAGIGNA